MRPSLPPRSSIGDCRCRLGHQSSSGHLQLGAACAGERPNDAPRTHRRPPSGWNADGHATGQEDYDRLRPPSSMDDHVILMCFSIDSPDSLRGILDNWIVDARHSYAHVPCHARRQLLHGYLECFERAENGAREAFETATRAAVRVSTSKN
ncbi:hypothetical protein HPB48_016879 [Haemaphysalis longicornis]|uniref:Uncharacterized protein n=1 Tax=Haemaphysalis longicornis TaxID=44386 RepID=A0A9J6FDP4_HAELO|nr:hypothetical protein HPB48_016879 [Haemaphysalis longicornis]